MMASQLAAAGARVRAVTAQHGDINGWLQQRGCHLDFVEVVSDPDYTLCKEYVTNVIATWA